MNCKLRSKGYFSFSSVQFIGVIYNHHDLFTSCRSALNHKYVLQRFLLNYSFSNGIQAQAYIAGFRKHQIKSDYVDCKDRKSTV